MKDVFIETKQKSKFLSFFVLDDEGLFRAVVEATNPESYVLGLMAKCDYTSCTKRYWFFKTHDNEIKLMYIPEQGHTRNCVKRKHTRPDEFNMKESFGKIFEFYKEVIKGGKLNAILAEKFKWTDQMIQTYEKNL